MGEHHTPPETHGLPPYIVVGWWYDLEPKPAPELMETRRLHPYDGVAYRIRKPETGEVRIYPTREDALEWASS